MRTFDHIQRAETNNPLHHRGDPLAMFPSLISPADLRRFLRSWPFRCTLAKDRSTRGKYFK